MRWFTNQLVKLARNRVSNNYPVDPSVKDEAIDALMHLLPTDAATGYPYFGTLTGTSAGSW